MHAPDPGRQLAIALHGAAIRGAAPGPAVRAALERYPLPQGAVWIVSIGKAARPMAKSAVAVLANDGRAPAGGLVVAPEEGDAPHPAIQAVVGDHPVPGDASFEAARLLGLLTTHVAPEDTVLVLLSGGATSLVGAPVAEVEGDELVQLFQSLLGSGVEIGAMNALRKRFSRWGGGRLAAALSPARVRCLAISDVAGDDPAAIGSGPCVPDPLTATELLALVESHALRDRVSPALRDHLTLVAHGAIPETPKPDHPAFARVTTEIILANRHALDAAARAARDAGFDVEIVDDELAGDAAAAGRACAELLLARASGSRADGARTDTAPRGLCLLWGGETTVTLPAVGATGIGGRTQELALAAAERLRHADVSGVRVTLLAAGTDGRDGPTDAAGAVVDADTWERIVGAGVDPAAALAAHDSYRALDAAGALLRTGHTGTNVRDVVVGIGNGGSRVIRSN